MPGKKPEQKMKNLSRWFTIDVDGQPPAKGWWDILWAVSDDRAEPVRAWWDGRRWRVRPRGRALKFGNNGIKGDRWRGLARKWKAK